MIDVQPYIDKLERARREIHKVIKYWPEFTLNSSGEAVRIGYDGCICDRRGVCPYLSQCFLNHDNIKSLPPFMRGQIKKAKSPKQALQLLTYNRYLKNEKAKNVPR